MKRSGDLLSDLSKESEYFIEAVSYIHQVIGDRSYCLQAHECTADCDLVLILVETSTVSGTGCEESGGGGGDALFPLVSSSEKDAEPVAAAADGDEYQWHYCPASGNLHECHPVHCAAQISTDDAVVCKVTGVVISSLELGNEMHSHRGEYNPDLDGTSRWQITDFKDPGIICVEDALANREARRIKKMIDDMYKNPPPPPPSFRPPPLLTLESTAATTTILYTGEKAETCKALILYNDEEREGSKRKRTGPVSKKRRIRAATEEENVFGIRYETNRLASDSRVGRLAKNNNFLIRAEIMFRRCLDSSKVSKDRETSEWLGSLEESFSKLAASLWKRVVSTPTYCKISNALSFDIFCMVLLTRYCRSGLIEPPFLCIVACPKFNRHMVANAHVLCNELRMIETIGVYTLAITRISKCISELRSMYRERRDPLWERRAPMRWPSMSDEDVQLYMEDAEDEEKEEDGAGASVKVSADGDGEEEEDHEDDILKTMQSMSSRPPALLAAQARRL